MSRNYSPSSKQLSDERMLVSRVQDALDEYHVGTDYEPLELTFSLRTPMAMAHPWLHLDGLVAHFAFREALGALYWVLPGKLPMPFEVPLPLEQTMGVWHGSVSVFSNEEWSSTTIYKRFASRQTELMTRGKKKSVNIASGRFRMFMMKLPYVPTRTVTFFAKGDHEDIGRLLSHVRFLGKKSAYGFGEVDSLEVSPCEEDQSMVSDGVAMRPLPVDILESYDDQVRLAFRPPFWDKRNVVLCAPPGANVVLR